MLLALETATRAGSIALADGERVVRQDVDLRGAGLVAALAGFLEREGVAAADVRAVGVSMGPGSFTGVRIGVAAAQGFCLAGKAVAVPVGTLEALAWSAAGTEWGVSGTLLLASVDARRGEVYAALYRAAPAGKPPERLWGPEPVSPGAVAARFGTLPDVDDAAAGVLLGDGAALLLPSFPKAAGWAAPARLGVTDAAAVARAAVWRLAQGGAVGPEQLEPVYLRKSDAEIHREQGRLPN